MSRRLGVSGEEIRSGSRVKDFSEVDSSYGMKLRLGTRVIAASAAHSRGPAGPVVRRSHSIGLEDSRD